MQVYNQLTKLLLLSIILFSCRTTKVYAPALTDLQLRTVTKVSLKELLLNKRKYQGLTIETQGEFIYGFEDFSIHYYDEFQIGDTIIKQKNFSGLGLELHRDLHFDQSYLESLRDKQIVVRGIFDTTDYIKISGLPEQGLLRNVFYFQPVDK
jgi:hypothetical protein